MPTVTILLPTYNRENDLPRAIRSALNQSYEDFELIVIDDGSTDSTSDVVNQFTDPRISYIQKPINEGQNAALNTGIKNSRGDYISFLDSDDEFSPKHLETCIALLESQNEEYGAVCTSYSHMKCGEKVGRTKIPEGRLTKDDIFKNNIGGFSTYTVKSEVFDQIGMLDESLPSCTDLNFTIKLYKAYELLGTPKELVRYSIDGGRITSNIDKGVKGQKITIDKFSDLMSPSQMAHAYHRMGILASERNINEARLYFGKAVYTDPTTPIRYLNFTGSLLGRRLFHKYRNMLGRL